MKTRKIPFDVAKAKAGATVVTREGLPVRIICYDRKHTTVGCLTALVKIGFNEEKVVSYHANGRVTHANAQPLSQSMLDLFIQEEVKEISAADLSEIKVGDTVWDILKSESGVVSTIDRKIDVRFGTGSFAFYSLDGRRSNDDFQRLFRARVGVCVPMVEV